MGALFAIEFKCGSLSFRLCYALDSPYTVGHEGTWLAN
jgi:hypothetical protein